MELSVACEHQYALDTHGNWINAKETLYSKHNEFFCGCPQKHKMKLVKPSGNAGKRTFCDYFAHINTQDVKRRKVEPDPCIQHAGESALHRMAKQRLREMHGFFHFVAQECPQCHGDQIFERCEGGRIGIEISSVDGKWRYDCLFVEESSKRKIALEILNTHASSSEKIANTRAQDGWDIAEFKATDVMTQLVIGKNTLLHNLIAQQKLCQQCLMQKAAEWQEECFFEEKNVLEKWNNVELTHAYWTYEALRLHRLDQISKFNNKLIVLGENNIKICKLIFTEFLLNINIQMNQGSKVKLRKIVREDSNGLLLYTQGDKHKNPRHFLYVIFTASDKPEELKQIQWKQVGVARDKVVMLSAEDVVRDLDSIISQYLKQSAHIFHNFEWPQSKSNGAAASFCARCCIYGHTSETCGVQFCFRCSRHGHSETNCREWTDAFDDRISRWD